MTHLRHHPLLWLCLSLCATNGSNPPAIYRRIFFNMTNVVRTSFYAAKKNISTVECGALTRGNLGMISTYCVGLNGECVMVTATYHAYYNDGTPADEYRCYTNQPPLIDYTAAKAECGAGPCCPAPFEMRGDMGCVLRYLEELYWADAVLHCQAYWPTSHIYAEPPSDAVRSFLYSKGNEVAWVGAHFVGNEKWEYVGGGEVAASSWDPSEPHVLNIWLLGPGGPWDCVIQTPNSRFKDYPCLAKVRSICKIDT